MRKSNLIITATMLTAATAAQAGYTTVNYRSGGNPSERSQAEIIARFYGNGTFNTTNFVRTSGAVDVDRRHDFQGTGAYANLLFKRVHDFNGAGATSLGGVLDIHAGHINSMTDQVWQDGVVQVQADAKYAGFRQRAGFKYGATDAVLSNQILDVTAVGTTGEMAGVVTAISAPSGGYFTAAQYQQFRLTRSGNGSSYSANEWSSKVGENADGLDHMITYQILDAANPGLHRFMVFFDDQGGGGDRDFNDFSMTLTVVPLPPAGWAGIGTMAAMFGVLAHRRRRLAS